jgi:high-affinity K+ transport system ATPase subunit B
MFAEIAMNKLLWAIPLLILPILPNLWSIVHLYKHEFPSTNERAAWLVALIVLPIIGGLGYIFFAVRRTKKHNVISH